MVEFSKDKEKLLNSIEIRSKDKNSWIALEYVKSKSHCITSSLIKPNNEELFFDDRQVNLVIDGYIKPKYNLEIGIPQVSLVFPILFCIYISRGFLEIESQLLQVIY